jgi:N-acylneuraminate cytidylyltransferase
VDHPAVEIDSVADLDLCTAIVAQGRGGISDTRLAGLCALVMDFDGVHTNNLVITDSDGRESVTTSRGDGMGLSLLRDSGRWSLLILSKERNPVVLRRAEKLRIEVQNAVDDKVATLSGWLVERGLSWSQVLYVGNDVNDIEVMARAGLAACPADAQPSAKTAAEWVLAASGGRGALRELCDRLLALP